MLFVVRNYMSYAEMRRCNTERIIWYSTGSRVFLEDSSWRILWEATKILETKLTCPLLNFYIEKSVATSSLTLYLAKYWSVPISISSAPYESINFVQHAMSKE